MNIILINHYAGSNRHGMEYRPYYLAREWVRLGHPVTRLAASSSHLRVLSPRHPFIVSMQWAENFAYRKADRVVSLLPKAEAHMQSHGMDPRKFAYVPNGVEVSDWQSSVTPVPQAQSEILGSLRREGRFIVGYAGAHGAANGLEMLVEAAQLLRGRPVTVVLVGEGPCKQRLQQKALQLRLATTVFLAQVAKLLVTALLASMDER